MNIDQTEKNFERIIKIFNFLRVLAVDYQFDHDHPDYCGYINTIPIEHGIPDEDVTYISLQITHFNNLLKPHGLRISKSTISEFILTELVTTE